METERDEFAIPSNRGRFEIVVCSESAIPLISTLLTQLVVSQNRLDFGHHNWKRALRNT